MISRRLVFLASVLVSAAVYYALYAVAPNVFLLRADDLPNSISRAFEVDLYRGPIPERRPIEDTLQQSLASRPGDVRDLLDQELADLPPVDTELEAADVPEPIAEVLEREHDLAQDDALLSGLEAQLVAIPEQSAREGIEIARRFVKENESRLVAPDDLPAFALPGPGGFGLPGGGGPGGMTVDDAPGDAPSETESEPSVPEAPAWAALSPENAPVSRAVPGLPDEVVMPIKTLQEETREASAFESMDALVQLEATTFVDPQTREGFFQLRILPREGLAIEPLSRDLTFVIDSSKSIVQRKLDLTVRGLSDTLGRLRARDRFNIVVFRDSAQQFRETLVPATPENIEDARAYLEDLESLGSTDVYGAVRPILDTVPRVGHPSLVIVISDGRPTEGNLEGRALINALSEENTNNHTVFTFGGGNTVNRYLMELLAYRNRGISYTAPRIDDIDEHLPRFLARFEDALLANVQADYSRVDESTIFPRQLPDFYRDRALTVFGRYRPGEDSHVVVRFRGNAGEEPRDIIARAELAETSTGDRAIAQGWAFEKTYHLIGEMTRLGEQPELLEEIERLSDRYGIRTTYAQ